MRSQRPEEDSRQRRPPHHRPGGGDRVRDPQRADRRQELGEHVPPSASPQRGGRTDQPTLGSSGPGASWFPGGPGRHLLAEHGTQAWQSVMETPAWLLPVQERGSSGHGPSDGRHGVGPPLRRASWTQESTAAATTLPLSPWHVWRASHHTPNACLPKGTQTDRRCDDRGRRAPLVTLPVCLGPQLLGPLGGEQRLPRLCPPVSRWFPCATTTR